MDEQLGSVLGVGISVFGEMLDEPFFGDNTSLGNVVHAYVDLGRYREKSRK
jgi:hypothetical protein